MIQLPDRDRLRVKFKQLFKMKKLLKEDDFEWKFKLLYNILPNTAAVLSFTSYLMHTQIKLKVLD